jgi:hypothetical protein
MDRLLRTISILDAMAAARFEAVGVLPTSRDFEKDKFYDDCRPTAVMQCFLQQEKRQLVL